MTGLVALLLGVAVLMAAPADSPRLAAVPGQGGARWPSAARRWSPRQRRTAGAEVALAIAEALAPALEAGLPPVAALAHAVADLDTAGRGSREPAGVEDLRRWARQVAAAAGTGEPASSLLSRGATTVGSRELALLAEAWSLTEVTGGPLADAARTTAALIRSARAQRRRLAAAVAGAHSTMNILTALPLGGPLLALALGVDPAALYLGSPLCICCLVAGVALALAGRAWVRRLVAQAVEGPVVA